MAKVVVKDGKHFRMRRGKLVEIPPEWVGKTTHKQTKRKRKSDWSRSKRSTEKQKLKKEYNA